MAAAAIFAGVSAVSTIAGTVMSVRGARQSARAQAEAGEYAAQAEERQGVVNRRDRSAAITQTLQEVGDVARNKRRTLSSIRAAYGNSHLRMEGSPLDVLEDASIEMANDEARTLYKGRVRAQGYTEEAAMHDIQAGLYRKEAGFAIQAGNYSAAAAFFQGVGSAASIGYNYARG